MCKVLAMRPADPPKSRTPATPLYPILPNSQDLRSLDPPPYHPPPLIPQALPTAAAPPVAPLVAPLGELGGWEAAAVPGPGGWEAAAAPGPIENETNREGPAGRTRGRTQHEPNPRLPDSTVALPLREIGPLDETGNPQLQYWPFSTSDLHNWKTQNARFSDNPKDLTALLDSIMFTHQPTWDDCQQLLHILFTTEEQERIQLEARKLVPGDDALQRVHEDVWPKLKELYETGPLPIPHQFRPGDWVLVKRRWQGTLEPRWKGPFQVILTMPTAIKVDRITTWIHFAHAKPVDPSSDLIGPSKTTWTVDQTKDNPLKLTLRHQRTEP
ncbi:uncharacterized protein LOC122474465 isoform X1 [Prionailurus bengalensis]|uniref:uncharacterized protein LOC122474465 isoform X1 n=1 Tax=Prionailurus bengalensis TaxID=37029 RepID=UPI001CA8C9C3|nr:uncharacterized protein LOC122474465 isoform X1 [Prionailurus bengalensis]